MAGGLWDVESYGALSGYRWWAVGEDGATTKADALTACCACGGGVPVPPMPPSPPPDMPPLPPSSSPLLSPSPPPLPAVSPRGCTYKAAANYDADATVDDGICVFQGCFDGAGRIPDGDFNRRNGFTLGELAAATLQGETRLRY